MDAEPAADLIGDRYALVERIGQGGMAQVWRATDRTLEREVAVKTVDIQGEDHDQTLARFRREAIATAGLNDPYVVSVFDAGMNGDRAFLVMELLDGPSLAPLLKTEPPIEVIRAVGILRQVAQGLGAAHAIGITHRDVKPGNIVLHRGNAKIVDFGIARLTESLGEALTKTATAIGTASYMSPEQALGDPVGPPSDIYALGAVAIALLTGQPPFTGGSVAVARAHVSDVAPRLRSRRPDVPQALDDLVAAMLVKDPSARPSAMEVGGALARIAHQVVAAPAGGPATGSQARVGSPGGPFTPAPAPGPPATGPRPAVPGPAAQQGRPPVQPQRPMPTAPSGPSPTTGQRPLVQPPPVRPGGPPANPHPTLPGRPGGQAPAAMTGGYPPPPPGSAPVYPASTGASSWGWWAALGLLGAGALVLVTIWLMNL